MPPACIYMIAVWAALAWPLLPKTAAFNLSAVSNYRCGWAVIEIAPY